MGLVYLNICVILPKTFQKGWVILYLLTIGAVIGVFSLIQTWVSSLLLIKSISGFGFFSTVQIAGVYLIQVLFVAVSTAMTMLKTDLEREKEEQNLRHAKLEAEFRFLQSQVNPHFLFNSLNNLYALAYTRDPRTPEAILKLSDLMRYQLEATKSDKPEKVNLDAELTFLKSYIELEEIKSDPKPNLSFEVNGEPRGVKIPPLLLIPLVENAFKHGNAGSDPQAWIRCLLKISPGVKKNLHFRVENSFNPSLGINKNQNHGIGLSNLKERLDLLFPGNHTLETKIENLVFSASMEINGLD